MTTEFPGWFNAQAMIEQSLPRPRANWWKWVAASAFVGLLFATLGGGGNATSELMLRLFAAVLFVAFVTAVLLITIMLNRAVVEERQQVEQVERLVTLRQWPSAAAALHGLLLRPMLSDRARIEALLYLTSVLDRYHKFSDAITVQTYLLQAAEIDGMAAFGLRASRAMAMLREDHLLDADRAMSELKRMPGVADTGLFALVSIFRDVKTGHYDEAIELFEKRRTAIAAQLGHRSADAHLLIAMAYRARGLHDLAAERFRDATLLAPPVELLRRYPETAPLFNELQPAPAPSEAC